MDIKKSAVSFFVGVGALTIILILIAVPAVVIINILNFGSEGCVGEVVIEGFISTEEIPETILSPGVAGSETMAKKIRELNNMNNIKSILIVINSPGGTAVATKEVYDAINDLDKPKVAYFRETAASGGYYVALPTDYIISEHEALTGSIGARAELWDLTSLMQNIGINNTMFNYGDKKDMGSPFRPITDQENILFQEIANESFQEFKNKVILHRGSKLKNDDEIFDSRIMTGRQAYAHGLVDELGTKQQAIDKAGELGGLDKEPQVCKIAMTSGGSISSLFMSKFALFAQNIGYGIAQGMKTYGQSSVKLLYN